LEAFPEGALTISNGLEAMSLYDPKTDYKSSRFPPHDWNRLEGFFVELTDTSFDQQPIVDLIRHIRSAYAKDRLFAYQSMHTLVVTINNPIEHNRDCLRIDYDAEQKTLHFAYFGSPFRAVEFEKATNRPKPSKSSTTSFV
jgi:hypothetical protein